VKDYQDVDDLIDEEVVPCLSNIAAFVEEHEAQDKLRHNNRDTSRDCCPCKDVDDAANIALPSSVEVNEIMLPDTLTTTRLNRFGVRIDVQWYLYKVRVILSE
jgi:hypothetical protein